LLYLSHKTREKEIILVDDLYFWMGKQIIFFLKKACSIGITGFRRFCFCSGSYFCIGAEGEKEIYGCHCLYFYILPMLAFQTIHSIATGNGEWNYRRTIGIF
jgi:uncharacterized protein (DUF1499 family)